MMSRLFLFSLLSLLCASLSTASVLPSSPSSPTSAHIFDLVNSRLAYYNPATLLTHTSHYHAQTGTSCAAGAPHYLRVSLAYDSILCVTTGGKAKVEAYLRSCFAEAKAIFARDTCVRLELVAIRGFCDPTVGVFSALISPISLSWSTRYSSPSMSNVFTERFGFPSLPSVPSLPSLSIDPSMLAKSLDPRKVVNALKMMYEHAFDKDSELVVFVSGIPFDSINLAITVPGNACLPYINYAWVFGTGATILAHEIGHCLAAPHSLRPGIMTIQNFGIVPKKFTSDSVFFITTYVDTVGKCLSTTPHAGVIG